MPGLTEQLRKYRLLALVGLLFSALAFSALAISDPPVFHDLAVYHQAADKALHHRSVYDVEGHYQFKYAPIVALIFGFLFAPFDFYLLARIYYPVAILSWIALVLAAAHIYARLALTRFGAHEVAAVVSVFILIYAVPLRDELKLGQLNILPLGLLFLLFRHLEAPRRNPVRVFWMGVMLALAVSVKLYCVIAIPVLVFGGHWRIVVIGALAFFALNVLGVSLWSGLPFGITEFLFWSHTLFASSSDLLFSRYNVSLVGATGKLTGVAPLAWAVLFAACGIFLAVLLLMSRRRVHPMLQLPFVLVAITVLNPLSWPYWILLTFPATCWILLQFLSLSRAAQVVLAASACPVLVTVWAENYLFANTWGSAAVNLFLAIAYGWLVLWGAPSTRLSASERAC